MDLGHQLLVPDPKSGILHGLKQQLIFDEPLPGRLMETKLVQQSRIGIGTQRRQEALTLCLCNSLHFALWNLYPIDSRCGGLPASAEIFLDPP